MLGADQPHGRFGKNERGGDSGISGRQQAILGPARSASRVAFYFA